MVSPFSARYTLNTGTGAADAANTATSEADATTKVRRSASDVGAVGFRPDDGAVTAEGTFLQIDRLTPSCGRSAG
ncbi:hypothetical protein [Micropruina glycogenica]|uniref:hypothetical protein n=1 Tax=Micropruina glycogenica TaxID=75385 RepID=UPI0026878EB9